MHEKQHSGIITFNIKLRVNHYELLLLLLYFLIIHLIIYMIIRLLFLHCKRCSTSFGNNLLN